MRDEGLHASVQRRNFREPLFHLARPWKTAAGGRGDVAVGRCLIYDRRGTDHNKSGEEDRMWLPAWVVVGALLLAAGNAAAQTVSDARSFPERAVRIVVPFPAGGP